MNPSKIRWLATYILAGKLLVLPVKALDFWVAPTGSAHGEGTRVFPFAGPAMALEKARQLRQSGKISLAEPVHIFLASGVYPLTRPLRFDAEDTAMVICAATPDEHPELSGGVQIRRWRMLNQSPSGLPKVAHGKVWVANAPKAAGHFIRFRQLWVNEEKAVRARNPDDDQLAPLVAWDKTGQTATIPAAVLAGIQQPVQLEMIVDQVWETAVLRIQSIQVSGTNALVTFKQPEGKIEFQHKWPPVIVSTNYHAPFFLANSIAFLDQPGEWYEDVAAGKIYYWPRDGEDMKQAKVFAPAIETLVQIEGAPGRIPANIQFKGITFAHTTWLRPSEQGDVPLQAGMFLLDAKTLSPKGMPYHRGLDNLAWIGRPPAAVTVKNAGSIVFENCRFEELASAGLDFESGTHDDLVQGCVFHDIGGNGIQLGKFSDTNVETHLPYNPSEGNEICVREKISNNVFSDCGSEDWGCVGIGVGYAQNISIQHNEVFNLPYTGISVGWGWTKMTNALRDNSIIANRVHDVGRRLGDLGGIYVMSAQPGTVIAKNYISDIKPSSFVPDPLHWFYIYLDEGSSGITVRDNWCPAEKFLKNANGPGNIWTNNGPGVSEIITNAAGLEPAFQNLLNTNKSQ